MYQQKYKIASSDFKWVWCRVRLAVYGFMLFFVFPAFSQTDKLAMVCGDNKLVMIDYGKSVDSIPSVVWTWDAQQAMDLPQDFREKKFNTMDDCKAVRKGSAILVSSSSGAVALLDAQTRKVLFYASVPNAHSIEMLPGNRLVAAASTAKGGNKIMLFDLTRPDKVLFTDSLYSAHGLVWDQKRKSLFALGYDVLREYKMETPDRLKIANSWKIPGESGHDLYPDADGKHLFLTEHTGAWKFDLFTHTFHKIPDFPDAENIKSVGRDRRGQYIFTVPEKSWWTYHVSFFSPSRKLAFPDMKVYKARWFSQE